MPKTDFNKNNMDKASSPYLQQHQDNPVNWQEWNEDTLKHAGKEGKPIFVSVGFSSCHWCHEMRHEAFGDSETADFLNNNFVSIKVDKEERPDIDAYLMAFLIMIQKQGGWPLNAVLTSDLKPMIAASYLPAVPKKGLASLLQLLIEMKKRYPKIKDKIPMFFPSYKEKELMPEADLVKFLYKIFDSNNGGFGAQSKFPMFSTLVFLNDNYERFKDKDSKEMLEKTLKAISLNGLQDHLQGGFYRLCVDPNWEIPHFEKMLYDQAMGLMVYSKAFKLFGKQEYKDVAEKILKCLKETFEENNLYHSSVNADTDFEEGASYLWTYNEIKKELTEKEFNEFLLTYKITEKGNFKGKCHLVKKESKLLPEIEEKLLNIRKKRLQPFTDKKIISSWNALTGIALIENYRNTGNKKSKEKALKLFDALLKANYKNKKLARSSNDGKLQENEFLEDYGALLAFACYVHEETGENLELIKEFVKKVNSFKDEILWVTNKAEDFISMTQEGNDNPIPSSVSFAEFGLLKASKILKTSKNHLDCSYPLNHDFYNLIVRQSKD